MKFTIVIMQADSLEARVVVSTITGETPEALATRARTELLEKAGRVRAARTKQVMTEATLDTFAHVFESVVLAQAQTGESRFVTAYTRGGEEVFQAEGQIALIGKATDITCLIDVESDAALAGQTSWHDAAAAKLGRAPVASDITFEDFSDQDMLDSITGKEG